MWCFALCLYLAIVSHYSALFFTLAVGLYALARIADSHLPRKVVMAWAAGQAGALAIYVFLYVTHVSKLKNSIAVWSTGFDSSYFHADSDRSLRFYLGKYSRIFSCSSSRSDSSPMPRCCFSPPASHIFSARTCCPASETRHRAAWAFFSCFPFSPFGARPSRGFILMLGAATPYFLPHL